MFNNAGQLNVAVSGTATIGDTFNNSGTVTNNGGTLVFANGGTESGPFAVAAGATLNLSGGTFTFNTGATISGAGNFVVSGATANLGSNLQLAGLGTFTVSGGTVTVGGGLSLGGTWTFSGGTATLTGTATVSGNAINVSGGTVNFTGTGPWQPSTLGVSSGTLGGAAPVVVQNPGGFAWSGGTIRGVVGFNGGSFSGSTLYLAGGQLINSGALAWNVRINTGYGSVISNLAGAIINLAANNSAGTCGACGGWTGPQTFYNGGQLNVAGTGTTAIGDTFNNSGTVTNNGGTLTLSGGGSESGPFTVAAGATFTLSGGTYTFNSAATISGAGNFVASGATADLGSNLQLAGLGIFTVSGGTVTVGGGLSLGGTWTFSGGTATLTGTATVSGNAINVAGGTVNFNGAGPWQPSTLGVSSGTLGGVAPVVVQNPGGLTWSGGTIKGVVGFNGGSFSGSTLYLAGGQLINSGALAWNVRINTGYGSVISNLAGAIINLAANNSAGTCGACGGWTGPQTFYNGGQLDVAGTGTTTIEDTFNNSGTVDVESGTLALTGGYALTGGSLNFGINGVGSFGRVTFAGSPVLAGALVAHLNNGFFPGVGNSFAVLTYTSKTGVFGSVSLPTTGLAWQINYGATALTLAVTNLAPVVVITSPANYASFVAPTNVTITATATASNAAITKVDFYQGTNGLGEVLTNPYSVTWSNVPPGVYVLSATATGASGAVGVSSPVNITVLPTIAGTNFLWVGGISSDWFTPDNWSPSGIPGTQDAANVVNGGTVFLSRAAGVACLNLAFGTITGSGTLTVTNTFYWNGGALACPASLTPGAVLNLDTTMALALENVLTNGGTVNWVGAGCLPVYNNGSNYFGGIVNLAGAVFNAQTDQTISNYCGQEYFLNAGLFQKTQGTNTTTVGISVDNTGTVSVLTGRVLLNGGCANSGVLIARNATLSLGGTWLNNGMISGVNGTINLGGTFTLGSGSTFTQSGGVVNLNGLLDNNNATLVLNAASGPWMMQGGAIQGGTVMTTNGIALVVGGSGTLDAVTLNGTLDVGSTASGAKLTVTNGLALNGSLFVGNAANRGYGGVSFGGSQTLSGNATVVFGNASRNSNAVVVAGAGQTLTLMPGVKIQGQNGTVGSGTSTVWGGPANVILVNQGAISAQVAGGIIAVSAQPFDNQGTLEALNGATVQVLQNVTSAGNISVGAASLMNLPGSMTLNGLNYLNTQLGGTLQVSGNLLGNTANKGRFSALGTLVLNGTGTASSPQLFEVMGQDVWASQLGFIHNFNYGTITLASGTFVQLINQYQNSGSAGAEALYVNSLVVPAGATLNLNGLRVYARASQVGGTVLNGTVTVIPNSGPIAFNQPSLGNIAAAGQMDQWTFFARAGEFYTVLVDPGSGSGTAPYLGYAEVKVVNTNGLILTSKTNASSGAAVLLSSVAITNDGTYSVQVHASPAFPSSSGHYLVTVWQTTPNVQPLVMGQIASGSIPTPYSLDQWTFAANAGDQVRFHLVNISGPGVGFDLTGPAGPLGFTNLAADSGFINLPASGSYKITAHSANGQYGIIYAFEVFQTVVTNLPLGTVYQGQWVASGQAVLFQFNLPAGAPMQIVLNNLAANNHANIYVGLGQPPTPSSFAYSSTKASPNQQVLLPLATAGTWYVLAYGDNIQTPGSFTVQASSAALLLFAVTPNRTGLNSPSTLTLTGAGFGGSSSVQFVDGSSHVYPATSISVDSFTQITATEAAGVLPPGAYSIRVSHGSDGSATLTNCFQVLATGAPNLATSLTLPSQIGYHMPATIYGNYANTGDAAMPAPLLVLTSTQNGRSAALLTLDSSLVAQGLWTSAKPAGFYNSIQFLGSGQTPGVLQPGESLNLPVYYAGWQQPWDFSYPPVNWNLGVVKADDPTPMDWTSLKTNLQSSTIPADAWEAIWMAFTNQVGSTWGDYVTMLDNNAAYLGGLGIKVNDVGTLVGFQLMLADGLSPLRTLAKSMDASVPTPGPSLTFSRFFGEPISQRCALGPFGRGWSHNWQYSLQRRSDGTITVVGPANSQRTFLPDTRSGYFIEAGDTGTLAAGSAGSFTLTEKTGFLYSYGSDGKLQYVQDLNRKTIRLSYTGNQLTSLTHSSGQTIQIAYNAAGLIETVTDNLGRQTVLSYDGVNEHLVGAQYSDGRTATYTYNTTGALAQLHELTAIATSCCNWRYFTYDQQGRLTATYLQGHTEATTYDYGPGGLVTVTDALGNPTQLFYDYRGTLLKTVDPNTNSLSRVLDQNDNLVSVIDDAGRSYTYSYDSNGNVARSLDAAGNSTQFSFSTAFNRLASLTDAKGNVTRYAYDPYGHVQSTTFADGSLESWTYDADGNRQTWINRRGHQTFYTWNNSGLMTGKYFADGSAAEYNYDSRGNLTNATTYDSMLTPLESVGMTYDGSNHLVRMDYPEGRYLAFEYDAAGRRTSSVDQLGHRLNYSYDVAGRPQGITNELNGLVVVCQYDAAGRTITRTLGNGIHTTYDYDRIGQLLNLTNYFSNGTMISRFNYTYDARGRRATMSTVDGNWNYSYDDLGQLSHAVYDAATTNIPNQNLTYVYDSLGNRNLTIENGVTNSYSVNSLNQYQSVGATNYTFDADGNLIKVSSPQGTTLFSYNDENRLLEITSLQGTWTYTYDGFGNRVATEVDGTARRYVIDPLGLGNVVSEYDRHCNLIAHYDHGMGNEGLVSRSDAGNTQTVFTFDAIGNVREIVAPSGSIDNAYAYSPFGLLVSKKEAFQNSFKFVGRSGVMDDGSGFVYMRQRFYEPGLGAFTGADPLGITGDSPNLYAYCRNSPVLRTDPSGLSSCNPDGCGSRSHWSYPLIPNGMFGEYDFTEACNKHDLCYATKNAVKSICDLQFLGNMLMFGGGDRAVEFAMIYYTFVAFSPASQKAFDWAQTHCAGGDPGRDPDRDPWRGPDRGPGDGPTPVTKPTDPNQLTGPAGYGAGGFVSLASTMAYRIDFENMTNSSAPAQQVSIKDQLGSNYDWNTFNVTEIGFGDRLIAVPPGSAHFETNLVVSVLGTNIQVQIQVGIQVASGQIYANFRSIDPVTSLPPPVNIGFLPPEDGTGRGQGHVSFTIRAKAGLSTGTQLRNVALISFDGQPAISTDQVDAFNAAAGTDPAKQCLVTIDAVAPSSHVLPLPAQSALLQIPVFWTGQDDPAGAGVGSFDVYVSDNGGAWTLWQSATTNTTASFRGTPLHTYGFYSAAHDNAGNVEAAHASADATTTVVARPSLELAVNPAGTALNTADTFAYTLSVSNGGTLNLTGVVLSNPLPAGLYVDWVQYSRGSCDVSDDLIVWTLGNLSTNRAAAITVTATVLGTSTMTNLMVVSDNAGVASASARQVIQVGTSWPQLNIALTNGQVAIALTNQQVVMSWSDPAALFILESTMDVEFDDGWTTVTNAPVIVGDERTVALPATNASQFYRLKKP